MRYSLAHALSVAAVIGTIMSQTAPTAAGADDLASPAPAPVRAGTSAPASPVAASPPASTGPAMPAAATPPAPAASTAPATPPAGAPGGNDPSTTVTFAVTSGALTITVPSTASLGSGTPGNVITGLLGPVTVADNRALLTAAWTATVSASNFTTGTGTAAETIPVGDAAYDTGTVTHTGTITITATDLPALSATAQTVVTGTAGTGNNSATWSPTITVSVPAGAVGGDYTGIVTHSVS